jgi:long-subunit acyl-CoA synthetase (AMP-forming)
MLKDGNFCRQITYEKMGIRAREIGCLLRQLGAANSGKVLLLSENCP